MMLVAASLAAICFAGYPAQEPELEIVLSRASAYVESYEQALGMMIAREEYRQRVPSIVDWVGGRKVYLSDGQERHLLSDYMMVRLPSEESDLWAGFRAVIEVDGRPVSDRLERLQTIIEGSMEETLELWQKLSAESARYNIGGVTRNINVPTFALRILRKENRDRFEFEHIDDDRVEGLDVWVLAYEERATPTLITNRQEDVFAHGRMWVDPVDGRIVRTDVRTYDEANELHSEIRVRYQPDDELGIWVPRDMRERYKVGRERVEGNARYSNFQQFEVTVDTSIGK
ncbi:MAG: hypothetical protein BMS9Abin37_2281 [Acidobacteriota bacterium]|nr:MAG: hypothetical protein BMS9Abin37_2281 [Acidobacteriota bacterium]